MNVEIVVPGKLSSHLQNAFDFYLKKLKRFANLTVTFTKLGGDVNRESKQVILRREKDEILKKVKNRKFILIDLHGKQMDSVSFSNLVENKMLSGEILFVIGGPLGIDDELRKKASLKISLSKMTFTHEFTLVILLEQLFRAFKIINNEKYHY
ncbi:23S rRNA (pseudouridine1915-N3)-methyltransferase [Thermosipho japonicus]|uniref:Ribosomal RNA large subunit methyltransferase H n=1 Tax=Thermosipho japonicus TaxID=90323 RepID=A0A841GFM0_9BACT|nr:23S rRNA (pseudouridine(1915)-N(3))-methyltransferase RlmH [Thermosipho japonicus]MBB6062426.1 23S rRNA (pseudouridine1915-N3)-methyltransferase [Thermosipho japonicus]